MTEEQQDVPQPTPIESENADARNDVPNEGSQEGLDQGPADPDDQLVVGRRNEDLNPDGEQANKEASDDTES